MAYEYSEPTQAELEQAEAEAMVRPSDSWMRDDRLYTSHAPVITWAENGGDVISESNYLRVLERLCEVAGPDDRVVIDGTIRDWAVGPLRTVFVQVRDDEGRFTRVWREAIAIALYLRDRYPVFDEDDVSEMEFERWTAAAEEEMERAAQDYLELDGEDLNRKFRYTAIGELQAGGEIDWNHWPERDQLAEAYREVRDAYYAEVGHAHQVAHIAGQGALSL